ncbi:MAG: chemotaxis-specific protein-glutamate methyltransferase CheB [Capsulimonadaceae bacterium]|nr:chemotaxis-specific protein-glutamate methyltransferase CheB [Capsulimonadaceae bacterium]
MAERKIRALIVDVSATMRALLSHILSADPDVDVVGAVPDINLIRDKLARMNVDVLTFNAALAGWEGTVALSETVKAYRLPVVVLGSRTHPEYAARYASLDQRIVHYVPLPKSARTAGETEINLIVDLVKSAARKGWNLERASSPPTADAAAAIEERVRAARVPVGSYYSREIIAIGASTGGTQAIAEVLRSFPPDAPATVIVQHMPKGFTASFAKHLNTAMAVEVKEAQDGDEVRPGRVLIAPGGSHMVVVRRAGQYRASVVDTAPVNLHRPSVDVLFDSLTSVGSHTVAAILTGMGADGAAGIARLHSSGARTIAQDQESCVVFGMPREAIRLNAVDSVLPLSRIGKELLSLARR